MKWLVGRILNLTFLYFIKVEFSSDAKRCSKKAMGIKSRQQPNTDIVRHVVDIKFDMSLFTHHELASFP